MKSRYPLAGGAVLAAIAMLLAVLPGHAAAATTIQIKGKTHKGLRFSAPDTVKPGKKLEIENLTDPRKVGPHTFTLVEKRYLPQERSEYRECFDPGHVCNTVAEAHKVDFDAETIGKENVESGRDGWDKSFTVKKFGDSHFLGDGKGQTYARRVSAKDGETLSFLCVIHPDMQGKIRITK